MRRVVRLLVLVVAVVVTTASTARASTISYIDSFDPDDQYFSFTGATCTSTNGSSTDTVDGADPTNGCVELSLSLSLASYTKPPDVLTTADLYLYFYDDDDPGGNPEAVAISLDGLLQNLPEGEYAIGSIPSFFDVFASVEPDGTLNVLLHLGEQGEGQADFMFDGAELKATWEELGDIDPSRVPEPASLLVIGAGLAAAGYRRRMGIQ